MLLNEKLKTLRKEKNLTQEELAEKLNVSRQAITKWENGIGMPDIENLRAVSNFFEISLDELLKDELVLKNEENSDFMIRKEIEIEHAKKFDIKITKNNIEELTILKNNEEKVKIEVLSQENIKELMKIKIDDIYNKMDININLKDCNHVKILIYLPEKYIDDIEVKAKSKVMNIENIDIKKLEYDGVLKYLHVRKSKGRIILNTTCCDIEAEYDGFNGGLEVNIINSTARVKLPENAEYMTILKGKNNSFINHHDTMDATNFVELNGINSKLIFE
ncbi:MAG: helix-turn-helix domain-containing protein [Clostridia bacterium]|nr:helix-turn-helix domain-containing protein [Clostridia bacterium]